MKNDAFMSEFFANGINPFPLDIGCKLCRNFIPGGWNDDYGGHDSDECRKYPNRANLKNFPFKNPKCLEKRNKF